MTSSETPGLELGTFSGPLDLLVEQARSKAIDLTTLSIREIIEQLSAALEAALGRVPLAQLGDWVVLASWLVMLRSRLLLPGTEPERVDAEREAGVVCDRAVQRERLLRAADALERRQRLGRDVFGRGRQREAGGSVSGAQRFSSAADLIGACLAVLNERDRKARRQPRIAPPVFWTAQDALARMMSLLRTLPPGSPLAEYLPERQAIDGEGKPGAGAATWLVTQAAIASTLLAGLELAKQGIVDVEQEQPLAAIRVYRLENSEGRASSISGA